jgi:P-type E1-E2 ATPase
VLRNGGEVISTTIYDVVVGDVFRVEAGVILPCDGLVFESNSIECDESAMTGEALMIKKNVDVNPFMLCGCKVFFFF